MATIALSSVIGVVSESGSSPVSTSSDASVSGTIPYISLDSFARNPSQFGSNLPDIRFSADMGIWMRLQNLSLPQVKFRGYFGHAININASIPHLKFYGTGNFVMSVGILPPITFDGDLKIEHDLSLDSKLPNISFNAVSGGMMYSKSRLPELSFNGLISNADDDHTGSISGMLPQIIRPDSFIYNDEISCTLSGNIPFPKFSGEIKRTNYGSMEGTLPMVRVSIIAEAQSEYGFSISGKLPELRISGSITGDPYFNITGMMPQINTGNSNGSVGTIEHQSTDDTSLTGDEVIRYRRNGNC